MISKEESELKTYERSRMSSANTYVQSLSSTFACFLELGVVVVVIISDIP